MFCQTEAFWEATLARYFGFVLDGGREQLEIPWDSKIRVYKGALRAREQN